MQVSGVHRAPIEREYRGYQWLWSGQHNPSSVISFQDFSFHPAYATIGLRLAATHGTLTTGRKAYFVLPFACIIRRMTLLADAVGSVALDIYRTPFAQFPPTPEETIIADAAFRPALVNADSTSDAALFTWATTLNKRDAIEFDVLSVSGIGALTLSLFVERLGQN